MSWIRGSSKSCARCSCSRAGIAQGRSLGCVKNVAVAPTIAALLGLSLKAVDGRVLKEALTNHDLPEGTSRVNFASHARAGTRIHVAGRWSLMAGYRFQHMSNGSTAASNPGLNSNIGYAGFSYRR